MGKYKSVRMPKEAYDNWMKRKKDMEATFKQVTGEKGDIPLTNIFLETSRIPLFDVRDLNRLVKKRWKKL